MQQRRTTDDRPGRVLIYARFSPKSRDRRDRTETIETQVDACRKHCRKQKWTVPTASEAYSDRDMSGADMKRPNLWAAIDSLKKGDVLLVYKLDRLARGVFLSHLIEQQLKKIGARLISVHGEGTWNDTAEDRLQRNIMRAIDEYQREAGAYRTQQAMLRQQAEGRRMSKHPPYGMRLDPHDFSRMIQDPEEQPAIARCIELDREGLSLRQITAIVEDEGFPSRADRWNHSQVQRILRRAREKAIQDVVS